MVAVTIQKNKLSRWQGGAQSGVYLMYSRAFSKVGGKNVGDLLRLFPV